MGVRVARIVDAVNGLFFRICWGRFLGMLSSRFSTTTGPEAGAFVSPHVQGGDVFTAQVVRYPLDNVGLIDQADDFNRCENCRYLPSEESVIESLSIKKPYLKAASSHRNGSGWKAFCSLGFLPSQHTLN